MPKEPITLQSEGTVNDMEMRFPAEHVWYRRGVFIVGLLFWGTAIYLGREYIFSFIQWAWGK